MKNGVSLCFVVDVGQGSCQILFLPQGDAIIIDCGPSNSYPTIKKILARYLSGRIISLIITHNHRDHDGSTTRLLADYHQIIDNVCFLQDGDRTKIRFLQYLFNLVQEGRFSQRSIHRLENNDSSPRVLYEDTSSCIKLELLYPSFTQALTAFPKSNEMSGVLKLTQNGATETTAIVFSGDSTESTWKSLTNDFSAKFDCNVFIAPHHGAKIFNVPLKQIYPSIINPEYAIISAGSQNRYGHPDVALLEHFASCGIKTLCTQLATHCNITNDVGKFSCQIHPSHSQHKDSFAGVGCAGTILILLQDSSVVIPQDIYFRRCLMNNTLGLAPKCLPKKTG
jgi:beta-lactamase superfamily II metal-dependent hydrolase